MTRRVEGQVLRRRCGHCGEEHFDFEFRGDTDMATEGLVAATSPGYVVVGIREVRGVEWTAVVRDDPVPIEAGFDRTFGGPGWRVPRVLRWEDDVAVVACLECEGGECREFERVTPGEFTERGGRLLLDEGLAL